MVSEEASIKVIRQLVQGKVVTIRLVAALTIGGKVAPCYQVEVANRSDGHSMATNADLSEALIHACEGMVEG